jgi:hypothetical protein
MATGPSDRQLREERDEIPAEQSDRNWTELLQELRVTQTGAQILFSLLLTVPFSPRFATVTPFQRGGCSSWTCCSPPRRSSCW